MAKGGGGQSGQVDYPEYIKTIHGQALDNNGADTPSSSVTDLVNTALSSSPYTGESAYDPTTPLGNITTELALFSDSIDALDTDADWTTFMDAASTWIEGHIHSEVEISKEFEAINRQIRDNLDMVVLPRFRGGMRDINAVMSSSFAIGESIIEATSQKDVNKFLADLRLRMKERHDEMTFKSAIEMLHQELQKAELKKALSHYTTEINRLSIVAKKEQTDTDLYIAVQDAKWDLDSIMYIGNMIAAIAGASTVREGIDGPSTLRTALGGALSGAAGGAAIGTLVPGLGTMAGAGIGGLVGLLGGLF